MTHSYIDLHTHTRWGSQCAYMTPDELVHRAKMVGLHGVCITEHNQIWTREAIKGLCDKHDFLVIGGVEVSTDVGEILVFGLHESVVKVALASELREIVASAGAYMVAAHPFRGLVVPSPAAHDHSLSHEQAADLPVFAYIDDLEVYNGMAGEWEQKFAAEIAERLHKKGTGGSDAHAVLGVGSGVTIFDAEIKSEEEFVAALKKGRYSCANGRRLPDLKVRGRKHQ